MKDVITSDDILGKKAVDSDGDILGVVIKIHIDNNDKKILGLTVDQGFMKPDLYIGIDYIRHFGIDAVLLNEYPTEKLMGLNVYSSTGKNLGSVIKVRQANNRLKEITFTRMFQKHLIVGVSDIKEIGNSIILKPGVKPSEQISSQD